MSSSLTELTTQLGKTFDEFLGSILTTDPQQEKEEGGQGLDTQINTLKASFLEVESQLKDIRLKALSDQELSTIEANKLLKRDIEIKNKTIAKYVDKLEEWEKEIPILIENSKKAVALRTDGTDFNSDIVVAQPPIMEGGEIVADEVPEETIAVEDTDMPAATPISITELEPIIQTNNDGDDDDDDDEDDDVEFEEV